MMVEISISQTEGVVGEVDIMCKRNSTELQYLNTKYKSHTPECFKIILTAVKPVHIIKDINAFGFGFFLFDNIYGCNGVIKMNDRSSKDELSHDIYITVNDGEHLFTNEIACSEHLEKFISELNTFLINIEQNNRYRI